MKKRGLGPLYVITDKNLIPKASCYLELVERFEETVEQAIKGGANVVQLREKDSTADEIIALGKGLLKITKRYQLPLIVNDFPHIAKAIGADGVHLGESDCSVGEARNILGEGAIIGVSCYNQISRGLAAQSEGADYVAFGTPFFTPTKPNREPTPIDVLKEASRKIKRIPVFAIGGITEANAELILESGADGIAVITSVFGAPDPEKAARALSSLINN